MDSELRPLSARMSVVARADGSAQFSQGATTLLAGVFGPVEARPHLEKTDRAAVEVTLRPAAGATRVADRDGEAALRGVAEVCLLTAAHPRTAVHLTVQRLDDDGCQDAVAFNAACMALVDAGLPMKCLFAAVTVVVNREGAIEVDPPAKRASQAKATLTFVFQSRNLTLLSSRQRGRCSEFEMQRAFAAAKDACQHVFVFYRECLTKKFSKELAA